MGLPWVQGEISGEMVGGRITARVLSAIKVEGDRPSSFEESGATRSVYERLNSGCEDFFEFTTLGFMGGAVGWVLPTTNLCWLPNLMERVERHNGAPLPEWTYCALVRNAGAPTIQFCAEPAGGMRDDLETDWLFDLLDEGLELGVYNDEGYAGFRLPSGYEQYQDDFDRKQAEWWGWVEPGIPRSAYVQVEFLPIGRDLLNGEPGTIVPCFTAGEFSFLKTATLKLEGSGWKLRDLECRRTENGWEPLNRRVVGITRSLIQGPMLWQFAREGGLDECGPHFPLSGEVVEYVLSHLSIPLLGPNGLDWLE